MAQTFRLVGGAGTGKTTELLTILSKLERRGIDDPYKIGFVSFTRAARAEAAARAANSYQCKASDLERHGWFRTIHSVCYQALGRPDGVLSDDADSKDFLRSEVHPQASPVDDEAGIAQATPAQAALAIWTLARNQLKPLDEVWRWAMRAASDTPPLDYCRRIATKYEQAKNLHGRRDFVDLLLDVAGLRASPEHGLSVVMERGSVPELPVWFFDEQQDASALLDHVCKRLVRSLETQFVYVVGDPFQCQPAGTPVLTADGYKPIELLDPIKDKIIAYNKKDSRFYGTGSLIPFKIASREIDSSELIEVTFSDGTKSLCTPNHKWIVRTKRKDCYATYLMKKGNRWRIGTVQMFSKKGNASTIKNGSFRLKMRMNQEDAEAVWVLGVFDTDKEARIYEQIASCRFGIPQVTFRPPSSKKTNLDLFFIDSVFRELGDLTENALRCLASHNLHFAFPFCSKADRAKNGELACRFIYACNLIPGIHTVPKIKGSFFERNKRNSNKQRGNRGVGKESDWIDVTSIIQQAGGNRVVVYSLEVSQHQTYVTTNGIVTGNSIYSFSGASASHFMSWQVDAERVMPRSWRCPAPVHEFGERLLRPCRDYWDRGIAPAEHDGELVRGKQVDDIAAMIDPRESWLLLARTHYIALRWQSALDALGIPWVNTHGGGGWAAPVRNAATRALWTLERRGPITPEDWAATLKHLPAAMLTRGTKTNFEPASAPEVIELPDLAEVGAKPELIETIASGSWRSLVPKSDAYVKALERWGEDTVNDPQVKIGTIHSVKGSEADNVAVLTSSSARIAGAMSRDRDTADEERRVAYVAATRARRRLMLVADPRSRFLSPLGY